MVEKHTIHLTDGRVEIDGDDVSIFLSEPIKFQRKHWVVPLSPREEAERTFRSTGPDEKIRAMLATAIRAAPMVVYEES